jgi:hypothetical protein
MEDKREGFLTGANGEKQRERRRKAGGFSTEARFFVLIVPWCEKVRVFQYFAFFACFAVEKKSVFVFDPAIAPLSLFAPVQLGVLHICGRARPSRHAGLQSFSAPHNFSYAQSVFSRRALAGWFR